MYNTVDLRMFVEDGIKGSLIGDVNIVIGGSNASNQLNAVDTFLRRIVAIVNDYHTVAGLD